MDYYLFNQTEYSRNRIPMSNKMISFWVIILIFDHGNIKQKIISKKIQLLKYRQNANRLKSIDTFTNQGLSSFYQKIRRLMTYSHPKVTISNRYNVNMQITHQLTTAY